LAVLLLLIISIISQVSFAFSIFFVISFASGELTAFWYSVSFFSSDFILLTAVSYFSKNDLYFSSHLFFSLNQSKKIFNSIIFCHLGLAFSKTSKISF